VIENKVTDRIEVAYRVRLGPQAFAAKAMAYLMRGNNAVAVLLSKGEKRLRPGDVYFSGALGCYAVVLSVDRFDMERQHLTIAEEEEFTRG
jgi:hypothetical protein